MITKDEATTIVLEQIKRLESPGVPFAINEVATIEKPFGWVFFYNSRRFLETRDELSQLAGNGPIIVNRTTGAVVLGRSNKPVQTFIEEYERSLW